MAICLTASSAAAPAAHAAFGAGAANTFYTFDPGTNRIVDRAQQSEGGADAIRAERDTTDTRGDARMLVDVTGDSPVLRAFGQSNATDAQAIGGGTGVMAVQFDGPDGTRFTYDVTLTGDLTPPTDTANASSVARLSAIVRLLDADATYLSMFP